MRKLILAVALSCVSAGFCGTVSAAGLKASDCRPLTAENAAACCAAANLRSVLRLQDAPLCQALANRPNQIVASPSTALGSPPGVTNPPGETNNPPGTPPGTADNGINNGFGNGDQSAPGNSGPNNNAENDAGGRGYPGGSAH